VKLSLGGAGSTPKKARGTLAVAHKIPQTEAHITLLADKLKDHSQAIWGSIEDTQREILVGIARNELRNCDESLKICDRKSQSNQTTMLDLLRPEL